MTMSTTAYKKAKILLIHPPAFETGSILSNLRYPPMGILFLASVLRRCGYAVKIFDCNAENRPLQQIGSIVKGFAPHVVGLSFTSILAEGAFRLAAIIKSLDQNIAVVSGGYHPTVMPEEVMADPNIDFICYGEGEDTLPELLEKIMTRDKDFESVRGIYFRKNGEITKTEPRPLIENIDDIPFPAYDLLDFNRYSSLSSLRKPYTTFIRSRGCPFRCTFCGVQKIFSRRYRCQSPKKTVEEIERLVKLFGVREILFKDSDFIIDKANVKEFCEQLISKHFDLIWGCNARVDLISKDILLLMKRAGCYQISFGVESGDQTMLNIFQKDATVEQSRVAIRLTKEAGIKTVAHFIIGGPGETHESIKRTIDLAKELDLDYADFNFLSAFPGSEIYESALRNGWFIDKKPRSYSLENLRVNATKLSAEELNQAVAKAYGEFYFRPSYIWKRLRNLNMSDFANSLRGVIAVSKRVAAGACYNADHE